MFKLYDYQERLVNEARNALARRAKGVLIQSPPGSGKSVVIAEIARLTTERNKRVLFLVHRRELVEQIEATFKSHDVNLALCTISTVIKARNRLNSLPKPDLIITDETHHSRAQTYQTIYDFYADVPRLGFTATPWRLNGKGFQDIYEVMVKGQSVQWLIDHQRLAKFDYYSVPKVDQAKLIAKGSDFTEASITEALKTSIIGDSVKNYQNLAKGTKAILYAHNVAFSAKYAEAFNQAGIPAAHADSQTPAQERASIMSDFKAGKIQVLCNCDLISEGFDVPDCECVILTRPTQSLVLYLQQAMRCMRYQPNKKAIIIDHALNFERFDLPNIDREWTLADREKQTKRPKEDVPSTVTCPYCCAVTETAKLKQADYICPICQNSLEVIKEKYEKIIIEAELKLIEQQTFKTDYQFIELQQAYRDKSLTQLHTLEDWYLYAKTHNYKDGWLKFNVPELEDASWPVFQKTITPLRKKYQAIFAS